MSSPRSPRLQTGRPRIALSVGDAAGVGPELALRCAALPEVQQLCLPILIGPAGVLARVSEQLGLPLPPTVEWTVIEARTLSDDQAAVVTDVGALPSDQVDPGKFTAATGRASFEAVESAIASAMARQVDAVVTGPIQKEAWHQAGISFPGHTELLAERTGAGEVRMMLTSETISCALVTIHVPLADVPAALTVDGVAQTIDLAAEAIARRLDRQPRVTVCGLNPHAGEHGLFSHGEESEVIEPAIRRAQAAGRQVTGPLPPDTAFTPAQRQRTDVYVCMYHDQGLIPLKALSFEDAVNVTLGLPIVRTSPDHGTAMDLAWEGRANHLSMLAAIRLAADLASPVATPS